VRFFCSAMFEKEDSAGHKSDQYSGSGKSTQIQTTFA
jgi:hypothetical protein